MRQRWILHPIEKRLVPAEEYVRPSPPRADFPAPMVICDTMDGVQSMLDGKTYTSKSKLRQTYKEAGVAEVGDQAPLTKQPPPPPDEKAIRETVEKSFAAVDKLDNVNETAAMAEAMTVGRS